LAFFNAVYCKHESGAAIANNTPARPGSSSDDPGKGIKGKKVKGIIDVKVLVLDWY